MSKNGVANFGGNEDVAGFLRLLADSIEKGDSELPKYKIPLEDFQKLKVGIKKRGELYKLKFKVSYPEGETDTLDEELEYSNLKKRMKVYFKEIKKALDRDILPSSEIVAVFLEDSRRMTGFTGGMGEEFYERYLAACDTLEYAYELRDINALKSAWQELNNQKEACHNKYK